MPIGTRKNQLYALALPLIGKRPAWREAGCDDDTRGDERERVTRALLRNHAVGACVCALRGGALAETYWAGYARLSPRVAVTPETIFRTASVAKLVTALLVMRLQTLGKLDVDEDIGALWGSPIRNPHCPDAPLTLASLMSHTSGMVDSPAYFASLAAPSAVSALLADGACFADRKPGERFQYSNFAAGLIGCLLERRFGVSLETLARRELFEPLGVQATYDLSALTGAPLADSCRVLPPSRAPSFDARARIAAAAPIAEPDPERHYALASGSLFLTAGALARLTATLTGASALISAECARRMKTPLLGWPDQAVKMRHGLGLLTLEDAAIAPRTLYGHQGFAYGAVNGVFFDDDGNGFCSLNSGASERRAGHLSQLNRELIEIFCGGKACGIS